MKIHSNQYCFMVKKDDRYESIKYYENSFYAKDQIQNIIKEIEQEYPEYKGKIIPFEMVLENN